MALTKGHKKVGGRQKGAVNKISSGAKSNLASVFESIGGRDKMAKWANNNLTEFYRLYSRLLPHEVNADLTSSDGSMKPTQIILQGIRAEPSNASDT